MSMQLRSIGSSSCRTERNQPATRFPIFSLGCVLPQAARISFCKTNPDLILQNQPGSHSAKPTRIPFCKTNPDLILQNQPGSHSSKPTRISFCKTNPDLILQNQPGSDLVVAGCEVLARQIRSGSKPVCQNHPARFWPTLPSRS